MSNSDTEFSKREKELFLEGINKYGIFDYKRIALLIPTQSELAVKKYIKHQIEEAGLFRLENSKYVYNKPNDKESYLDMWLRVLHRKKCGPDKGINILAITMKLIADLQTPSGTPEHFKECRDAYKIISRLLKGGSLPTQISQCLEQTTSSMALKIVQAKEDEEVQFFSNYNNINTDHGTICDQIDEPRHEISKRIKVVRKSTLNPFDVPANLLRSGYPKSTTEQPSSAKCKVAPHRLQKVNPSTSTSSVSSSKIAPCPTSDSSSTNVNNINKANTLVKSIDSEEIPSEINLEDSNEILKLIEHYSTC